MLRYKMKGHVQVMGYKSRDGLCRYQDTGPSITEGAQERAEVEHKNAVFVYGKMVMKKIGSS